MYFMFKCSHTSYLAMVKAFKIPNFYLKAGTLFLLPIKEKRSTNDQYPSLSSLFESKFAFETM